MQHHLLLEGSADTNKVAVKFLYKALFKDAADYQRRACKIFLLDLPVYQVAVGREHNFGFNAVAEILEITCNSFLMFFRHIFGEILLVGHQTEVVNQKLGYCQGTVRRGNGRKPLGSRAVFKEYAH
ncbi:hypothetical protein Barb6_02851 [Bacteroidales bacterium Barb6]|nr:hypothetical protein Barb6_02851 [Bacteroidales bacterium Barb6]